MVIEILIIIVSQYNALLDKYMILLIIFVGSNVKLIKYGIHIIVFVSQVMKGMNIFNVLYLVQLIMLI